MVSGQTERQTNPELPEGRRRWFDRVYLDIDDGAGVQPLSAHWEGGGLKWLRRLMRTIDISGHKSMRPAFRLAMKRQDVVPKQAATGKPRSTSVGELLTTKAH